MTKIQLNPRSWALLMLLGGSAVVFVVVSLGGMTMGGRAGGKAILAVGLAGVVAGVGLTQLVWPPRRAAAGDDRSAWKRAPILQKLLWIAGGLAGVVAAAVTQVVISGKI